VVSFEVVVGELQRPENPVLPLNTRAITPSDSTISKYSLNPCSLIARIGSMPHEIPCTVKKRNLPDNEVMNTDSQDAKLIALLERVSRQDQDALKSLYEACAGKLYGLALRVVTLRELAEDVLQEAFLKIWRSAPDYTASLSPPMAWMGMIVRSRALDLLRRRAVERTHLTQDMDETLADTLDGEGPTPLDFAQASQQAMALNQCLKRLESKHREVVNLAYLRDLSHSELAAQLQLPLGTVKTWIRRGLDQLRLCMARFA